MAEKIVFYGKVDGQNVYTYGPKAFDADWSGAFTAMEISNLLTKLPKVTTGKRMPIVIRRSGRAAEKANLKMWMERFECVLLSLNLDHFLINATKVNRLWVDKVFPSQLLTFSGNSQRTSRIIGDALCRMGLNYWGVVQQLTLAMSGFDSKEATGKRSAVASFTL